jgi:hypothetical protein
VRAQHRWAATAPPSTEVSHGDRATGEALLYPLDWLRVRLLLASRPWSGRLAGDRDARVALVGAAIVLLSLVLTASVPLYVLALGPILFGVPHLVADLRYCGWRNGLLTRRSTLLACGIPLLVMGFWGGLPLGLVAVAAAFAFTPGRPAVRAIGATLALAAAAVTLAHPVTTTIVMAHAHNFIAVGLWWAWRPRQRKHLFVLAALVLGTALVLGGAFDARLASSAGPSLTQLSFGSHAALLTGGLAGDSQGAWAGRWVLLFAFTQAVHYGVWLHLVRDDERARATPRTFVRSYRVFRAEFGRLGAFVLPLALVLCLGLALWATVDLVHAREGYFRFAQFHGSLELCAVAVMLVRRTRHD